MVVAQSYFVGIIFYIIVNVNHITFILREFISLLLDIIT